MTKHRHLPLIFGFLMMTVSAGAGQVNLLKPGQPAERHLPADQTMREWSSPVPSPTGDLKRIKVCRVDTVCKMRYREGYTARTRVRNLVAPMRYENESISIPESFTKQVRQALDNLRDKQGVTVRFIGYTDNAPLTDRDGSTYGDHLSLSKARAHRVAVTMQGILGLPSSAIASDGRGDSSPLASNETAQGRALNRHIEVEFWYDDPLQVLPEEPQLCPGDGLDEVVTKVYDPPWGSLPALKLENGQPIIPPGYAQSLNRALTDIANRTNARLRFIGYTKDERLDRRTASVYGDDIGLSAARARRAMETVVSDPLLSSAHSEHEGRGYVQSDDVVNIGFTQGEESFVRVQAVYDEPLALGDYEGVDVTRLTRELHPKSPYELNVMHITVDGKPIDDVGHSSSDIQRCTDIALEKASIQLRFDNLESRPRLGVAAHPVAVAMTDIETSPASVRFRMYTNYAAFLERAEIRIFDQQQSLEGVPLQIVAIDDAGFAKWEPPTEILTGSSRELKYLLRAYDGKGNFDETSARPLLLYREQSPSKVVASDGMAPRELLAAYGKNDLLRHQIPLGSGTVKVQGSRIPAGHTVWVAGHPVPVDAQGNFAAEEILPSGLHTVEVAVLDDAGNGSLYLRDLDFKSRDLFYLGVADLTVSGNRSSGPIDLFQGQNVQQPYDSSFGGRLAFYVNGKVSERWRLTASADTREGPVKNLFSNFLDKSPDSLFRRIDPDYYFPTFGDDGVVKEMAPTLGKFYVKASRGENYGMWGNFKVGYVGNEIAHVDRGLYGANAHYGSEVTTSFGERRIGIDGFAGTPGTLPSYEEFRGTGGSIYFLRHQDLLTGSERVRIEIRDKASGIVTGVVNLRDNTDYDIDHLQGRILLSQPLSSTADDNLLVRSSGLSGDEAYLVVRYEYTPGFTSMDEVAVGGQGHYWLNDHVRLGLTANSNQGDADSSLQAADLTLRKSTDSWIKVQTGRSQGLLSSQLRSDDGGFGFRSFDDTSFVNTDAIAYRADISVGIGDFIRGRKGRVTFYTQNLAAGYSAPGQATIKGTEYFGGTFRMPVTSRLTLAAKGDQRVEDLGLETRAIELNVVSKLTDRWSISTGVRNDLRKDNSLVVPLTQEQGERTDAVVQVAFDRSALWRAYAFVQDTVASSGGRKDNGRIGVGGSYRPLERFKIDAEVSDGDLGFGARLGTSYLYSEWTNLYLNYALENERTDNGQEVRRGNLVSGAKRKLSDTSSVYLEERYQDHGSLAGLTHATGVTLVPSEHWNVGASTEFGKLRDSFSGAETNRKATSFRLGYGKERLQWSSAIEYRRDNLEQIDLTHTNRTAWLFRNNFKLAVTPDWRVIGKLNHSVSDSSLGEFYDGGYTEAVVGYGYRPVRNDRLNALVKYTYFYNVPTTDQLTLQNVAAEFIQKSHIAALDVTFDVTADWSVGGKYAYRMGQVSLDREQRIFFDSAAQLAVMRVDWRFRKGWESLVEARMLGLPDVNQQRRGALAAVYRYLGKYVKVGTGYNFTDFSDDLTDLRYDHRGVFVNFIGTK